MSFIRRWSGARARLFPGTGGEGVGDLRRRDVLWCLAILLVGQVVLYLGHYFREIEPFPPVCYDQAEYLSIVYRTAALLLSGQPSAWADQIFSGMSPQGIMLELYGSVAQTIFTTRLSALSLNLGSLLLLQMAAYEAIRHHTASKLYGVIAVSLIVTLATLWPMCGGMFDYRPDFSAMCFFGTWVACIIRSRIFLDFKWSLLAGFAAVLLVLTRYVALVYIIGVTAGVLVLVALFLSDKARRFKLGALSLAPPLLIVLPMLYISRDALWEYYGVGHVTGEEPAVRAAEVGLSTLWDHVSWYPSNLVSWHLGPSFAISLGIVLCLLLLFSKLRPALSRFRILTLLVLLGAVIGPLIVLTIDEAKSPVVGGVVAPVVVLLAVLCANAVFGAARNITSARIVGGLTVMLAFIVFWLGVTDGPSESLRRDKFQWRQAVDRLNAMVLDRGWMTPLIFSDRLDAHITSGVFATAAWERMGVPIEYGRVHGKVTSVTKAQIFHAVDVADIVVLSVPSPNHVYPFMRNVAEYWDELRENVEANFLPAGTYNFGTGYPFSFFIRPRADLIGISGDWLLDTGTKISVVPSELVRTSALRLEGRSELALTPGQKANVRFGDRSLPVEFRADGNNYLITVDLHELAGPSDKPILVDVSFDKYFVPAQISASLDTRRLAIFAPRRVTLRAQ
ncbi:MAG: hypothetical protein K0S00_4490 [Xanthobacteraceae bacterium]|nr:hypothetical protein [Xanthobacteraceae bacterium]